MTGREGVEQRAPVFAGVWCLILEGSGLVSLGWSAWVNKPICVSHVSLVGRDLLSLDRGLFFHASTFPKGQNGEL